MVSDVNYYKKVVKRILIIGSILFVLYIFLKLSIFYIPFLIAFIISLFIEPIIRKIMKITNLTRKTSAIFTLIIVFAIIIGLLIWAIFGIISESSNILNNLNSIVEEIGSRTTLLVENVKFENIKLPNHIKEFMLNSIDNFLNKGTEYIQTLLTKIIDNFKHMPQILICIGITILATYFVCTDKMYILDQIEYHVPRMWVEKFLNKIRKVIKCLGDYVKAQIILTLITFIIVLIGLYIFKFMKLNITYPLLFAIIIGIVDALPILGSGTIMIPWAVISAFYGDIKLGICLVGLYFLIIVTRQLIEPKIVSNHVGIHPIFTLIAMYTGFKIFGIIGMFIGPIILIILVNVFENMIDNGLVKTIVDRK